MCSGLWPPSQLPRRCGSSPSWTRTGHYGKERIPSRSSCHLPDFDRRYARLQERLGASPGPPDTVIHGDLVTGNILVDEQARPLAVLDFGFLTTAGDPRLDAAIAANVMNMYGPHAPAITSVLTAQFAHDLDYPADVLLTYQAAYAVATSNAFTPDGSDGHFAWCIDQLRRRDITDALSV